MTFTPKQKKIIAAIPIMIIVYLSLTMIMYDIILEPQVNRITGRVATTVNVTQGIQNICNFNLYAGENLISFHCINGMFPVDFMLSNYTNDYIGLFAYEATGGIDPWRSTNPSLPSWVDQDLSYVMDYEGFWIIMNKDINYYLDGFYNMNNQTQLYAGWNLIGYPRNYSTAPAAAFASIDGNYSIVRKYDRGTDNWTYYIPGDPNSTLTMIDPDYGYWINMTVNDIWMYP